ncbi:hypothetical protein [Allobranchiibius sp. GilTou38]|uniref:hypothetical protein n=1 Tax=Allobranchiibius sp. GilTou38 TaxID=2815210 RepID=UPI001AA19044|nr:hypothetical protein [Allobranchiibius sp. GilTou38]MBO1768001.1 hypothetical protein [Allobranchiibius sp. GilTou38]
MSILGALLLAVGVGDLVRVRSVVASYAVGPLVLLVAALVADLHDAADIVLLVFAAAVAAAWRWLAGRAARSRHGETLALCLLGAGVLVVMIAAGSASHADGALGHWMRHSAFATLHELSPDRFLLVLGLGAVQLATGNELVRLVLTAIGAVKPEGQPQPSDELRGGRLLGPMERLFILGLGMAGQITAAGLVIAAKGLIRFPELQARRSARQEISGLGIDAVTEYFLVGSFVSWLVALGALGIVGLR